MVALGPQVAMTLSSTADLSASGDHDLSQCLRLRAGVAFDCGVNGTGGSWRKDCGREVRGLRVRGHIEGWVLHWWLWRERAGWCAEVAGKDVSWVVTRWDRCIEGVWRGSDRALDFPAIATPSHDISTWGFGASAPNLIRDVRRVDLRVEHVARLRGCDAEVSDTGRPRDARDHPVP